MLLLEKFEIEYDTKYLFEWYDWKIAGLRPSKNKNSTIY
jgi:hypothetical protein